MVILTDILIPCRRRILVTTQAHARYGIGLSFVARIPVFQWMDLFLANVSKYRVHENVFQLRVATLFRQFANLRLIYFFFTLVNMQTELSQSMRFAYRAMTPIEYRQYAVEYIEID